jgi:hypothetical protein
MFLNVSAIVPDMSGKAMVARAVLDRKVLLESWISASELLAFFMFQDNYQDN